MVKLSINPGLLFLAKMRYPRVCVGGQDLAFFIANNQIFSFLDRNSIDEGELSIAVCMLLTGGEATLARGGDFG